MNSAASKKGSLRSTVSILGRPSAESTFARWSSNQKLDLRGTKRPRADALRAVQRRDGRAPRPRRRRPGPRGPAGAAGAPGEGEDDEARRRARGPRCPAGPGTRPRPARRPPLPPGAPRGLEGGPEERRREQDVEPGLAQDLERAPGHEGAVGEERGRGAAARPARRTARGRERRSAFAAARPRTESARRAFAEAAVLTPSAEEHGGLHPGGQGGDPGRRAGAAVKGVAEAPALGERRRDVAGLRPVEHPGREARQVARRARPPRATTRPDHARSRNPRMGRQRRGGLTR